jgi:hypothetical protein
VFSKSKNPKNEQRTTLAKGKLALVFLKHYACCSDRKLIEQFNTNIDYQFFVISI